MSMASANFLPRVTASEPVAKVTAPPPSPAVPAVTASAAGAAMSGLAPDPRPRGGNAGAGSSRSRTSAQAATPPPEAVEALWINESPAMLSLSQEATQLRLAAVQAKGRVHAEPAPVEPSAPSTSESPPPTPQTDAEASGTLSDEELAVVRRLAARDRQVRTHEEAHRAAAGSLYRSGPTYDYVTGPDGRQYAVSGSVQIDTSAGRTPEETMRKAQLIQRSALAPVDPSGADRAVASAAAAMEARARHEQVAEKLASQHNASGSPGRNIDLTG